MLTIEGFSSAEIGDQLGVSPVTVLTYRRRAYHKLGISHAGALLRNAG